MNNRRKIIFIIIVFFQVASLAFIAGKRILLLKNSEKVLLKCEPVDPRSLFSGDYVILNYDISNLKHDLWLKSNANEYLVKNDTVYVALEKDIKSKFWKAKAFSKVKDKLLPKYKIIIRGKVKYNLFHSNTFRILYGIETYFIPQGQGHIIEQNLANISVEMAVSKDGESGINKLFLNDSEIIFY